MRAAHVIVVGVIAIVVGATPMQLRRITTLSSWFAWLEDEDVNAGDPAVGEDLRGKADNIFVDQDTGDLIIIESGFNDAADGVGPDHEPAVLRVPVDYDNGFGEIELIQ